MTKTLLPLTVALALSSFACAATDPDAEVGATEDAIEGDSTPSLPESVKLSCDSSALGHVEITLAEGWRRALPTRDVYFRSVVIERPGGETETLTVDGHGVRASYSIPIIEADREKGARVSVAAPPSGLETWPDVCYAKAPNPGFSIGLFAPSGEVDPQWSPSGPRAELSLRNPRVEAEMRSGIGWPTFGPDMLDGERKCEGAVAGYQGPSSVDMPDLTCVITTKGTAVER